MIKVSYFAPHFVDYHSGFYRAISQIGGIDLTVYYEKNVGFESWFDPNFNSRRNSNSGELIFKYKCINEFGIGGSGFFSRLGIKSSLILFFNRPHIVFINGFSYSSCWLNLVSAKLMGLKIYWRGETILKEKNAWYKDFAKRLFLRGCDKIFYSCTGNYDELSRLGLNIDRAAFIPSAVDNRKYGAAYLERRDRVKSLRIQMKVPQGKIVGCFVGRFNARKQVDKLVQIFSEDEFQADFYLILVGGYLDSSSKTNNVTAFGFAEKEFLFDCYAMSDFFILPSQYDASPKVVNEACCFRLPLILSNRAGVGSDLCCDGVNGWVIDPFDTESWRQSLRRLRTNKQKLREMGEASWGCVQRFDYQSGARSIEKCIRKDCVDET